MTKKTRTKNSPQWGDATKLVRGGLERTHYGETSEALYLNSGFVYDAPETAESRFDGTNNDPDVYVYGRYGNPTVTMFEQRLAHCLKGPRPAMPSPPAWRQFMVHWRVQLKTGDHIVASKALFGSCYQIITAILPRFGITHTLVDGNDLAAWEAAFNSNTKAVFLETPSNPTLQDC